MQPIYVNIWEKQWNWHLSNTAAGLRRALTNTQRHLQCQYYGQRTGIVVLAPLSQHHKNLALGGAKDTNIVAKLSCEAAWGNRREGSSAKVEVAQKCEAECKPKAGEYLQVRLSGQLVFKVPHNWLFDGTEHISIQIIRYGARYVISMRPNK